MRLDLTGKARAVLTDDPIEALVRAADALPPGVRDKFSVALQRLLGSVALQAGKPLFGTCETCTHFQGEGCCRDGANRYECGFVNEALTADELAQLCINFNAGKAGPPRAGTAWR